MEATATTFAEKVNPEFSRFFHSKSRERHHSPNAEKEIIQNSQLRMVELIVIIHTTRRVSSISSDTSPIQLHIRVERFLERYSGAIIQHKKQSNDSEANYDTKCSYYESCLLLAHSRFNVAAESQFVDNQLCDNQQN